MDIETQRLTIGAFEFDVDIAGPVDGPLVLFLHGFPQSKYAWRSELPALAKAGFRAAAPNQRGYSPGARPTLLSDYETHHLVDDVFAFADALTNTAAEVSARFHLVGHDWGGALAWLAAGRAPERLLSLTVLSRPHPDAFARALATSEDQAHRSRHHKAFLNPDTEHLLLEDSARRFYKMLASHNCPVDAASVYLETLGDEAAMGAAVNWYRATGGNLSAHTAANPDGLGPVSVPTLYIWGDEDSSVGPDAARWTADYVTGPYTFHRIKDAGHFITDEVPGAITQPLLQHLRSIAPN
ncbi:MAG: alpha/beta hydrolase [Alphaproteobacteria bacterium]|nr:alpha/beta hydrolase [Alphaproteobacteria bacterium]